MDVKARVQHLMDERGWTIYKVAKEANVPWSTVRNMFKRNTEPSIATLEAICKGMGVTLAQFFDTTNSSETIDEEQRLLRCWGQLCEEDQRVILYLAESLLQKDKSKG